MWSTGTCRFGEQISKMPLNSWPPRDLRVLRSRRAGGRRHLCAAERASHQESGQANAPGPSVRLPATTTARRVPALLLALRPAAPGLAGCAGARAGEASSRSRCRGRMSAAGAQVPGNSTAVQAGNSPVAQAVHGADVSSATPPPKGYLSDLVHQQIAVGVQGRGSARTGHGNGGDDRAQHCKAAPETPTQRHARRSTRRSRPSDAHNGQPTCA